MLSFSDCMKPGSLSPMVRQRKWSAETGPALQAESICSDSMAKARTMPSRISASPCSMKFPTCSTMRRSCRNWLLLCTSSAARRMTPQRCRIRAWPAACERPNFMTFRRPGLRPQRGMSFCSTSRSSATWAWCLRSILRSSGVGMLMVTSSMSSAESRGSSSSRVLTHRQSSCVLSLSLLIMMAALCARCVSSRDLPCGRVAAQDLRTVRVLSEKIAVSSFGSNCGPPSLLSLQKMVFPPGSA
mmetsp:Transcript_102492/g.330699  ORF Transcript_102492/g.330699 Transcript_102492/m.330699 type:complete len:243 (-) Transcript_102492:146-874(-)